MKNNIWKWIVNLWRGDSDPVVFEGTTAELLASLPKQPCCVEEEKADPRLNLEFLKLALQIEESKNQKKVVYVDVGNLPKAKAEAYIKAIMADCQDVNGNFFIPRREGGAGSEVVTLPPGGATLEKVLETAAKLKDFASQV